MNSRAYAACIAIMIAVTLAGCSPDGGDPLVEGSSGITMGTPMSGGAASPTAMPAGTPQPTVQAEAIRPMGLERVFAWLSPTQSTHMLQVPGEPDQYLISEQEGLMVLVSGAPGAPQGTQRTALDISAKVSTDNREEGLLGFTFHPGFAENGRLFVYYSAAEPRRSVLSEFRMSGGVIDPASERVIMEISQPFGNHNAGALAFGPDEYLYISLGDGGGAGDRYGYAQDLSTALGSVLRIDVDQPGVPYAVPPDNPFVDAQAANGMEAADEIWAYGLRNPWRMAFDPLTDELWTADVGQDDIEEVDLIVRGGNYGWDYKEGPECYEPSDNCEDEAAVSLIDPVAHYTHDDGCSVTGGYVYRGTRLPSLYGAYVYGDFCSGIIWALRHEDGETREQVELIDSGHNIPAFSQMPDGEVYVLTYGPGIYRFVER